ncbi:MAG: hypothetical protein Tsb0034_00570 [Ekhidna sp.]
MKSLITGILCLFFSHFSSAQLEAITELLNEKPETEKTVIWLCDTAFSFYRNDPFITQQIATLALNKAEAWDIDMGRARAHHVIGVSYWARDLYDSSITHYLKAMRYYEELELYRGVALININIGTIYDDLGQPERGKPYLLNSLSVLRQLDDSVNIGRTLNNLGSLYATLGKRDSALLFYKECMAIRQNLNDSIGVARVHNNVADIYLEHTDSDFMSDAIQEARIHLIQGLEYLKEGADTNLQATMFANMGKVLTELGRYDEAKGYLDKAITLSEQIDSKMRLQLAYQYYKDFHKQRGNYQKALEYLEKEIAIDKEQRSAEISKQIDQLNIQFETEKKERQLAELEREQAIEKGRRNVIIVTAVAIIATIGLLLLNVYSKRKRDHQIADLKMQQLNDEIDKKNKEISSYTLSFIQKNQLMDELKGQINELKKQSDISTNKQLTRINKIVDETFRSDEEWKTFQLTFDQMHGGFFAALKRQFPDLGPSELKLCALLRLNMNLKESARILGIAPNSVKTARYCLRKKLGLKTEDGLIDFLIRFEKESAMPLS